MSIVDEFWIVDATQTAKYGNFDKTSLVLYNPCWCSFGVVHVQLHAYAPMMFKDVWIVATTQTAKYGRIDKNSVQYNHG